MTGDGPPERGQGPAEDDAIWAEQTPFDFPATPATPPGAAPTDDRGRLTWLRLARSDGVGPITFARLLNRYRSAEAALEAAADWSARAAAAGRRAIVIAPIERAEAEMAAAAAIGARPLCLGAADYPPKLAEIDGAPPLLWARGATGTLAGSALRERPIAVVGARNASALGRRFAGLLARDLARAGAAVVSGLARGVDAAAHAGSLEAIEAEGLGGAAATLAGGVDHVYPPEHVALYDRLVANGVAVSEMPIGFQPQARHFPRRNRIVSGLSLGVVVVEAAERSGSLITARFAVEQGREAMAAPGHPMDARAGGCNALLREGATLIRGVDDVLEAVAARLSPPAPRPNASRPAERSSPPLAAPSQTARRSAAASPVEGGSAGPEAELETALFAELGVAPVEIDALFRALKCSAEAGAAALLELEIDGRVERLPGGFVRRAAGAV